MFTCDICNDRHIALPITNGFFSGDLCVEHSKQLQEALALAANIFRTADASALTDARCREWVERMMATQLEPE